MAPRLPAKATRLPLLDEATLSSIGSVYLSSDGTNSGDWTYVEWSDWSTRAKKANSVTVGLDGTPYVTTTGLGAKGFLTLSIPSCSATLYDALVALVTATHYTASLHHAQKGTVAYEVQVIAVTAPADAQWAASDPVETVTVRCVVFGTA